MRNLSYYGNTRKCAEFCSKSKKVQKITLKTTYWAESPPPCSRTFASTLVTLQIFGLIIVVDVDLVTLANLSRVKKSGRIQY